ncbi:MAG: TetR/AcrR family transcriptional regulator [Polyangiaceae bacterium]
MSANTPKTIVSRAEKRDAILAAARQIFSTRGVIDVTMEDIAKAAKVSKGALYLHFASKDELYLHLSAQGGKGLLERMKQAKSAPNGFLQVKAMAHEYADYCREDPTRFRLDVAWLAPGYQVDFKFPMAQEYRTVITEVMRVSVEAFVQGQRDGSIRPDLRQRRPSTKSGAPFWVSSFCGPRRSPPRGHRCLRRIRWCGNKLRRERVPRSTWRDSYRTSSIA